MKPRLKDILKPKIENLTLIKIWPVFFLNLQKCPSYLIVKITHYYIISDNVNIRSGGGKYCLKLISFSRRNMTIRGSNLCRWVIFVSYKYMNHINICQSKPDKNNKRVNIL